MTSGEETTAKALAFRNAGSRRRSARPAIALDALNSHLGYFVRRLQVWVFQDFISTLARIDISPAQFSVLVGGWRQQRAVASGTGDDTLGIERARLARLLHRLEERGLIQRLQSSADGRRHALQLTPQGGAIAGARQDAGGAAPKEIDRKTRRGTSPDGAGRVARFQMSCI